jgi:hypothetical protein
MKPSIPCKALPARSTPSPCPRRWQTFFGSWGIGGRGLLPDLDDLKEDEEELAEGIGIIFL